MLPIRLIAVMLVSGHLAAYAQGVGLVDFQNDRRLTSPPDRLVRDGSGAPLVGTNYVAQLYYGAYDAAPSSLNPVTAAPAPFRDAAHAEPGTWAGGYRRLDGFTTGFLVALQVRVWDSTIAGNYEEAATLGFLNTQHGVSEPFLYLIPSISSPPSAFYIENFRGFMLVPEPSIALLGIIGIVGLYFARRRRE